jgi:hypothetical protein
MAQPSTREEMSFRVSWKADRRNRLELGTRFEGRNLALRLVALGYTQIYWYCGGREAWEVNGLPETNLDVQQW